MTLPRKVFIDTWDGTRPRWKEILLHVKWRGKDMREDLLQRITFTQGVLGGKPVIRGLRISVEMILELLTKGATEQEILEDYPELEPDDIRAALLYAHHLVAGEAIFDRTAAK